ncbi:rhomboid family intramembrane serine protease [Lysobacter pythonis]|uniref:Rhomboid family intramembrane serine protease n=1 Tax=Solilutibacter pythonis TaxID=2483112 RepID=A0A3M2I312_9GAMM|nr:rhomboid family intramembrane serine protease [Lysobacter pythonis]RMH93612.1 rhomboid family intramembrane serine protease [Lysobacter pythonis]
MFARLTAATKVFLIANVVAFGLQLLLGEGPMAWLMLWPLGDGGGPYAFMPWQLLTYGFLHGGLFHLFFNMLVLFMFGAPLEQVWGVRRFTQYYLACIVGAGVCQLAVGWWMLENGGDAYPTLGASGGVLGLVLAYGLIFPRQKVMIFPIPFFIPAKVAVVLIGAFALFAGFTGTMPSVAHFAHLGGMLTGWLLIRYWRGQPPFGGGGKRHLRSV